MPAFPRTELLAFQLTIQRVALPDSLFTAPVKHAAVVARKNDERVIGNAEFFQRSKNFTDRPVELFHKVAIQPAFAFAVEVRMRRKGMMNVVAGIIEEKGLLLFIHPAQCLSGEVLRAFFINIEIVRRLPADHARHTFRRCCMFFRIWFTVRFSASPVDQRIGWIEPDDTVVFDVDKRRMRVDDRDAVKVIEADFQRPRLQIPVPVRLAFAAESKMPFPDAGGGIAFAFEQTRQRGFIGVDN